MINILTLDNKTPGQAIKESLRRAVYTINMKNVAGVQSYVVESHIKNRYPGSAHWNPKKVTFSGNYNEGNVDIDIPGASRAYHDIDIYPVRAQSLAIPLHRAAYGLGPKDVQGLFKVPGRNVLAVQNGELGLTFMYALSRHVHQSRDASLLPSDDTLLDTASTAVMLHIDSELTKTLK